ncbi:MAG: bifunctional folylpolyglutamate synthase/dihydrofolate synthase [Ruminococcaceae bacterium]|nr:bifunctional folylpolyglutamate synthase/dihydrofolate synthase [Oscillospiraceae bacterium]
MTYTEALEYIHSVSWTFCKPGLERIGELCEKLGNPQNNLKFIHVAGTNGKGSFCSMLNSVLMESGLCVGLYTSPYIRFFNERMCVNREPISDGELAELCEYVKPIADSMTDKPTEFELITAIAFEYFKRHNCDVVVLEAGMGGRLDSTNIIRSPLLSVITGIALDHTAFLGDTVEKIAAEKAGIIKDNAPVLFGGTDDSAAEIIETVAKEKGSAYYRVDYNKLTEVNPSLDGTVFNYGKYVNMKIGLLGMYQPRNASVVINAVEILKSRGLNITESNLREGLSGAKWRGRFEIISRDPLMIFDGAHNPQGISSAVESIRTYFGDKKVYLLTGVLRDKDYSAIAEDLSSVASKAFTLTPDSPRALSSKEYAETLTKKGIDAKAYDTLKEALTAAKNSAKQDGVPLICLGSLYVYASLADEMGI